MRAQIVVFLQGVCATGAGAIGLVFLRFWRETQDVLFGFFGVAFWILAANWTWLAITSPTEEYQPYVYGLRFFAFVLIIVGILDKNRKSSP
jgi:hypothetical protein